MIKVSICLTDIPKEYIVSHANGKKYLNIKVCENKNGIDKFGNTHYVEVDTYNSQTKQSAEQKYYIGNGKEINFSKPSVTNDTQSAYGISDDDLGF